MGPGPGLLFPEHIGPICKADPVGETLSAVPSLPWLGSHRIGTDFPRAGPGRACRPASIPSPQPARFQTSGCQQVLSKFSSHLFLGSNQESLFWETVIC